MSHMTTWKLCQYFAHLIKKKKESQNPADSNKKKNK